MGSRLEKNSDSTRKRIENHEFQDEEGEEYEGSKFGGFTDYFRRKKIKLQNLDAEVRSSSFGNPQIFRGIVAHVNGYTQPSLNDLHRLIVTHGGGFMQYLDGKTTVTHIIAANLTPKKAIEFRKYRIVKPAWVVESVHSQKLLPWDSYRVLDEGHGQKLLGFDDGRIVSQTNTNQRGYRDQTKTSWYTSQVKTVAADIDDENGARFPGSQVMAHNGTGAYVDLPANMRKKMGETSTARLHEDIKPSSSESFEVTSSFVVALEHVTKLSVPEVPGGHAKPSSSVPDEPSEDSKVLRPATSETNDASALSFERPVTPRKGQAGAESASPNRRAEQLTAEEHNAILLADPHIRKSTTANPDFIKQYYSESRLHHLSMWKAELKLRFQQMALEKSSSQKPLKRKPGSRRYIMHVDFDSFFCAVSLKSAPEYVGKPTVVAHGSGPGSEIASCNYPARNFGIKNGMWMKRALELCSDIKVLPYDFPAYEEASKSFYEAIIDVGGIVQSVSVDEALVDISELCLGNLGTDTSEKNNETILGEQERADYIAEQLRTRIKSATGCAVSIGVGGNILLAKVALRKAKPAGKHQIKPAEVLEFIGELTLQDLPGVAHNIAGKLGEIGIQLVKDVRSLTKERLMTVLGPKTGEKLWEYSRGIDKTEVGEQVIRKSVSAEVNWGIRFISQPEAEQFVRNLCVELHRRLVEQKVRGRQFTMKIMRKAADAPLDPPKNLGHGKCDTFNKSIVLGVASNSAETLGREAVSILRSYGFSPGELRGLGVQMTKLESIKSHLEGVQDGSQKRIDFGKSIPKVPKQDIEDPIEDLENPQGRQFTPGAFRFTDHRHDKTPTKPTAPSVRKLDGDDPIDEIISPEKTNYTPVHPAAVISRANAADYSARKLLNMTGTQFIVPTQFDPTVLAELPSDIRSKLLAQRRNHTVSHSQSPTPDPAVDSSLKEQSESLPSQFDLEVFAALPEDVRAELLASHSSRVPRTPRKSKPPAQVKRWTPTKRRGRPAGSKNRKEDPYAAKVQSSFVAIKREPVTDSEADTDTLDQDFLSALPEEMRVEIIEEHKRKQLAKRGGLMTVANKRRRPPEAPQIGQRRLRLPARDPKPTFTTQELSTLEELRETLTAWHNAFEEEGPHPEDVAAMERYLRRVVMDEKDLAKVVGVVKWIAWLVDDNDFDQGGRLWRESLRSIREKVQDAVLERGLGKLDL